MNRFICTIRIIVILAIPLLLSFSPLVSAHPLSVSNSTLQVKADSAVLLFSIDDLSVIESIPGIDLNSDGALEESEVAQSKAEVGKWIQQNLNLRAAENDLEGTVNEILLQARGGKRIVVTTVHYTKLKSVDTLSFHDGLYKEGDTTYVNLLVIRKDPHITEKALSGDNRTAAFTIDDLGIHVAAANAVTSEQPTIGAVADKTADNHMENAAVISPDHPSDSNGASWQSFFLLGIHHIITGYDHLLFLLVLLLRKQSIMDYIKIATAFTLAHSLTLALAVLGWNPLPSRIVEIFIALSIVYVAVENILDKNHSRRWQLTFAFGLVHGLGFAGILADMNIPRSHLVSSLVSFNIGIEIVQVGLIVLASPLLATFQASKLYRKAFAIASSAIMCVGGFWVLERLL